MNQDIIIWKDVVGYEGYYLVSNKGQIKSLHARKKSNPFLSETNLTYDGYKRALLYKKGIYRKFRSFHRAVAEAFLPNPNNLPFVNHKDANKLNNCVENLEWCTVAENNWHAVRNNLRRVCKGERHKKSRLIFDTKAFVFYYSVQELSDLIGVNRSTLYSWIFGDAKHRNKTQYIEC